MQVDGRVNDPETSNTPLLEVRQIGKKFPGVTALNGVDFTLLAGEIHALVGENGSGKSTLIKILSGVYLSDEGEILISGVPVSFHSPIEAQKKGIATIHQEINLIPNMDVGSNIFLNREPLRGVVIDYAEMYRRSRQVLEQISVDLDPRTPVSRLTPAEKQLIEIAQALAKEMRLLILDEPTAALPAKDVEKLFEIITRLKSQGIGIIYVSHRLEEIERLADRVTVVRDGNLVTTRKMSDLTISEIIRLMVGRDVEGINRSSTTVESEVTLQAEDLGIDGLFEGVNLQLRRGEILGIAGLVGSGRSELAAALGGAVEAQNGRLKVNGSEVRLTSPAMALSRGIGFVPAERKAEGLAALLSVKDNVAMSSLSMLSRLGLLLDTTLTRVAQTFRKQLGIKVSSLEQKGGDLSGGNQQKVVLGKVLARGSKILVFDEPTRGIDVGTRREIYNLMDGLARDSRSIVVSSSDLPELLTTCDRIIAMYRGRCVAEFERGVSKEELLGAIFGQVGGSAVKVATTAERSSAAPGAPCPERKSFGTMASKLVGVPLLLVALIAYFSISTSGFATLTNVMNLTKQLSVLLLLATAQTFALVTGGIDLSMSSLIALEGMVLGLVGVPTNMFFGMVAGLLVALVLGLINGAVSGGLRAEPFIVTLGTMNMVRGAALLSRDGQVVTGFPSWFYFVSDGWIGPIPFMLGISFVFVIACHVLMTKMRFGRSLIAIGGNEEGARVSGVNVVQRKWAGYVISALLAGVAGILLAARLFSGQPAVGNGAYVDAVAAAVIGGVSLEGGRGSILGVGLGVLVISLLSNGLNLLNVQAYVQTIIMGSVLIIAVVMDRIRLMVAEKQH